MAKYIATIVGLGLAEAFVVIFFAGLGYEIALVMEQSGHREALGGVDPLWIGLLLGTGLGFVLGGSLLTEIVFSYPGQGYLRVQAVRNQDYPLMQGVFLVITLAVLFANILADVFYVLLDPRARQDG